MKKIRGFKLALHPKELRRRLRKSVDFAALGLQEEAAFQRHLDAMARRLSPAVLFDSLGPESAQTAALAPIPGLAHTVGLLTLGPGTEAYLASEDAAGAGRGALARLLLQAAVESSVFFVTDLLKDELEEERCELSPIHYLSDPAKTAALFDKLQGGKIGLRSAQGTLSPAFSAAFCLSWISKPRSRSHAAKSG